jgi:hypothetical protein
VDDAQSLSSQLVTNSGWYLKQVWRLPYKNETMYYSQ